MTAGRGIAHAETTPNANRGRLDGVQLWVALPDADRRVAPAFQSVAEVPRLEMSGGVAQVFAGALGEVASPAQRFSPLVGADVEVRRGEAITLPLDRNFEHGVFLLGGDCELEGEAVAAKTLYYLEAGRAEMTARSRGGARLLLVGG